MKAAFALVLFLSGAALADTTPTEGTDCPLMGSTADTTADCQALRAEFRTRLTDCLAERKIEAERRAESKGRDNAHSSRARYLICAAETRRSLGLAAK
jgi:hypothetical protein